MAKRNWVVGACVVLIAYLCFPACGPTKPGQTGGAGGVAGTAGSAATGGTSDAGSDADASPVACGCDDVRTVSGFPSPYPIPLPNAYQPLACYCDGAGSQCASSMHDFAEQFCQMGVPLVRRQGCGRATLGVPFAEPGPGPTFDVASGTMIGMHAESDAPFGVCRTTAYQYGETVDAFCPWIETCVLCNTYRGPLYPRCLDSFPTVEIKSPTNGVTLSTGDVSLVFSLAGAPSGLRATCQLDSAPPSPCTSPHTYTGVVDGPHTVKVTGVNSSGSSGPATVNFAVMTGARAQVKQVTAGASHTCALLVDGRVRCWGMVEYGQLGYGNTNPAPSEEFPTSRGDVNVGGPVLQISAGALHTCALLSTGKVRCWGDGTWGALGYGNTDTIGDNELPSSAGDVNVGGKVVQIAAGLDSHTCALLSTGGVRCWGDASRGQLGYLNAGFIGGGEVPSSAGDVSVGGKVVQIAAGNGHTCALLSTGKVRCWGENDSGQLGYGNTNTIGDDELPSSAGDVNVGGQVVQIAAGYLHTCALLSTGGVRCWGSGERGQVGYGNANTIGDDELPSSAGDVNVGGPVVQIAAGHDHTCALLSTGGVRCWGDGSDGRLGYGNGNNIGNDALPVSAGDVNVGGQVVQIATGSSHTCALLSTGNIRCWGNGMSGQLGYFRGGYAYFFANIGDNELPSSAGDVPLSQ